MNENSEDHTISTTESELVDSLKEESDTKPAESVKKHSETTKEGSDAAEGSNEKSSKVKSAEKKSGTKNKFVESESTIIISESMFQPKSKKPKRNKHVSIEISITKEGQPSLNPDETADSSLKIGIKNKLPIVDFPPFMRNVVRSITSEEGMRESKSCIKLYERQLDDDTLCDSCRWLVKAAQSADSIKSDTDEDKEVEELMRKWTFSNGEGKQSEVSVNETEVYTEEHVKRLLDTVHSCLLKSCILLTAEKLHKTARRPSGTISVTASDNDVLMEQLQDEGEEEDKISKLSGALATFVTKYLKCLDFFSS